MDRRFLWTAGLLNIAGEPAKQLTGERCFSKQKTTRRTGRRVVIINEESRICQQKLACFRKLGPMAEPGHKTLWRFSAGVVAPDGGGQDPHEAAAAGEAGGSAQTAPRYGEPDPDSDNDNGPRVTSGDFVARSPGMKYKHYAPKADMLIVEGERGDVKAEIERLKALNEGLGNKVGVLLFEEQAFIEAAHDFFARLRDLDREGVDLILAGALSDRNSVGFAVMNRMLKSAGYNIVKV